MTWETDFTMRFSLLERAFTPILRLAFNTIFTACEKSLAAARL